MQCWLSTSHDAFSIHMTPDTFFSVCVLGLIVLLDNNDIYLRVRNKRDESYIPLIEFSMHGGMQQSGNKIHVFALIQPLSSQRQQGEIPDFQSPCTPSPCTLCKINTLALERRALLYVCWHPLCSPLCKGQSVKTKPPILPYYILAGNPQQPPTDSHLS